MAEITEDQCLKMIKEQFPDSLKYEDDFRDLIDEDSGIYTKLFPFEECSIDVIKNNYQEQIIKIFNFVEYLLKEGNEDVQNAMATGYLEYLMTKDPDEIQFSKFVKYMGKESIAYCCAWDEFTGVRTKGLWDEAASDSL